jgi:hypothetical protein
MIDLIGKQRGNEMRWRLFIFLVAALVGGIACTRLSAAPATVGPPPKEISSEALVDYQVVTTGSEIIGPVDGLILSTETGDTLYVVVVLKDIYNFGRGATHGPQDHFLLIPWEDIMLAGNRQLVVDADARFVNDAPVFTELPDTSAPDWDAAVKAYWRE